MAKTQLFLIHGSDNWQSWKRLVAIRDRFLNQAGSIPDLTEFDLNNVETATLKQALLTVPFFVAHRLFILRGPFAANKEMQTVLLELLPKLSPTTIVVLYEDKPADGRTALWKWLKDNATVTTNEIPEGPLLDKRVTELASTCGVRVSLGASRLFIQSCSTDMWRLASEVAKVSSWVLSQGRDQVTEADCEAIGSLAVSPSVFALTDAIRDANLKQSIRLMKEISREQDPMATAGMVASLVRNAAKMVLAGTDRPQAELAKLTAIHPFVIKMSLSLARKQTKKSLARSYQHLIDFEKNVKEGRLEARIAIVLLVVRLNGSLKGVN